MSTMSINAFPIQLPKARPVAASAGRGRSSVRLTRRGRVVLFVVALLAVALLSVTWGSISTASGDDVPRRTTQTVIIHSGDTLWGLAAGLTGGSGVEEMIDEIISMNGLDSAVVRPGQKLRVPRL